MKHPTLRSVPQSDLIERLQQTFAPEKNQDDPDGYVSRVVAAVASVLAVFAIYYPTLDVGFVGWDTFPVIISSTVHSLEDIVRIFTEELMAGRYWWNFYRPVMNLTVAVDHAVWGLHPFGYQLSTLLLMAACTICLFTFVERLVGPRRSAAPWLAALFFLLHPVHYNVLPVLARRAEVLCALFFLLSLHVQLSPRRLVSSRPAVLPGILALVAIGSKETGLVLAPLTFLLVALYSPRRGLPSRLLHASVSSVPVLLALGVSVLARFAAIGSLGGRASAGFSQLGGAIQLGLRLIYPQEVMLETNLSLVLPAAIGASLTLCAVVWFSIRRPTAAQGFNVTSHRCRAVVFAFFWIVLMLLLHAYAARVHPWYNFFPSIGWAILTGVLIDGLVLAALRRDAMALRASAGLSALLLAVLLGWQARYSPLLCPYKEWVHASAILNDYLEHTAQLIRQAPDGAVVSGKMLPDRYWIRPSHELQHGARLKGVFILSRYSLQAWADLVFPDRNIRISKVSDSRAEPDEVVLALPGGMAVIGE